MTADQAPGMFEEIPVIGHFTLDEAAGKLRQIGAMTEAAEIERPGPLTGGFRDLFDWGAEKAWRYTTHQFGYVAPLTNGIPAAQPIRYAGAIEPDSTLQNGRINIHLDRLRIYEYPGGGQHHVMLTFKGQNQLPGSPEVVSFSQTFRVQERQLAGVTGYPIFIGLHVGTLGAAFQGFTVNVKNDADGAFLDLLDSPSFQSGLNLLTGIQPVLKPFTDMTLGVAKMLAKRNENVAVQDFYLGLDFTMSAFGSRLAEGNYVAVQVPSETAINWDEWAFNPAIGAVVHSTNSTESLPYNYVVFRVTRHLE
jgi:hypothetical protein